MSTERGQSQKHEHATPLLSTLLAAGWLALIHAYFWRRGIWQAARERGLL
jgi:hypothetical protein